MKSKYSLHQQSRRLHADTQTPISLFLQLSQETPHALLFESAEVDGRWGRFSVIASDFWLHAHCEAGKLKLNVMNPALEGLNQFDGLEFVDGLRQLIAALHIESDDDSQAPITRALYGYFGYEMAAIFQPKLAACVSVDDAESQLVLAGTVLVFDHLYNHLTQLSLAEHRNLVPMLHVDPEAIEIGDIRREPTPEQYEERVDLVRGLLHDGEAIQVVLSSQASAEFSGDAFTLYRRMRQINPSPYMFFMRLPGIDLFGSSPEVMVRVTNNKLQVSPIAGTRKRGVDEREDAILAAELLHDPKERAEHTMLVDLGRNDLGKIATPRSVKLERFMEVEKFSHVMHLTSKVTAQLKPELDALDVLAATFPAGTVSGAPKLRAMEIIAEMENCPRGPYAGCIGWLGLDDDAVYMDSGITIRSMWVKNGRLYWQSGAGIVFDSIASAEWQECLNKGKIIDAILNF